MRNNMQDIKLNYDDITVVPEAVTDICSRTECDPYDEYGYLPIFASCMSSVVSLENARSFNNARIRAVIPRSYSLEKRFSYLTETHTPNFVAFSLNEASKYFHKDSGICPPSSIENDWPLKICIDLANGHMKCLLDLVKRIKEDYGDKIIIMTGNIANPEAYKYYEEAGVDYVRCSIGTGCFTRDMLVETDNGVKQIKDIQIGDKVKTHTGKFETVTDTMSFYRKEKLFEIDGIKCTANHEFYVINQEDEDKVTEENLSDYAFWVKAEDLDKNKHRLIQL